jgi:transcriptional regulator with XRE-family HTH domain
LGAIANDIGHALRRTRTDRGLTLRDVEIRSEGRFTPSTIAGYERAERSISLRRFCELTTFYGLEPGVLLSEILHEGVRPTSSTKDAEWEFR